MFNFKRNLDQTIHKNISKQRAYSYAQRLQAALPEV